MQFEKPFEVIEIQTFIRPPNYDRMMRSISEADIFLSS